MDGDAQACGFCVATMAGGVAVALALAASSPASAGSRAVASGTDTGKVVVHGQVNRGLLTYGGAIEARPDLRIGSRLYASTSAGAARGLALRMDHGSQYLSDHFIHTQSRVLGQIQFESNSTATVNQADNTAVGADNFTQRKATRSVLREHAFGDALAGPRPDRLGRQLGG